MSALSSAKELQHASGSQIVDRFLGESLRRASERPRVDLRMAFNLWKQRCPRSTHTSGAGSAHDTLSPSPSSSFRSGARYLTSPTLTPPRGGVGMRIQDDHPHQVISLVPFGAAALSGGFVQVSCDIKQSMPACDVKPMSAGRFFPELLRLAHCTGESTKNTKHTKV